MCTVTDRCRYCKQPVPEDHIICADCTDERRQLEIDEAIDRYLDEGGDTNVDWWPYAREED